MNTWLTSTVKNYVKYFGKTTAPVVWDVGSRDGRDGVELAYRVLTGFDSPFLHGQVVCVEANPVQAEVIRGSYPQVVVHECAVGEWDGTAPFMVYEGDEGAVGSSSLDLGWKGDDLQGTVITVPVRRLDGLVTGDKAIDIMKIDVEGFSLQALKGLGDKLGQVRVIHVETETWTGSDRTVADYLSERGWLLVDTAEQWGGMPDMVWVNLKQVYKLG
jgi:FkbM family methyltransferase